MKSTRTMIPTVMTLDTRIVPTTTTFAPFTAVVVPSTITSQITTITPTVTSPSTSVLAPGGIPEYYGSIEIPVVVPATSGEGGLVSHTTIIVTSRDFYPQDQPIYLSTTPLTYTPTSSLA